MIINNIDTSSRGLFLTNLEIGEAEPKTKYIDIPYGNGSIDLTEALIGEVVYSDRVVKATFLIENYNEAIYDGLKSELHGLKTTISTKSGYYFICRIKIKPFIRRGTAGVFELEAICNPYMLKDNITTVSVSVVGTQEVILSNEQKRAVPTFVTDAEVQIVFGSGSYTVNAGTHTLPIVLEKGDNAIQFNGTANVTITYQEGAL